MGAAVKTVLVIDDDLDFRTSISEVLRSEGYEVHEAANAREGLEKIAADIPDLVVLDVIMESDSSGYEVNAAVKFRDEYMSGRDIPILMVSSIPLDPATLFCRSEEVGMITPDAYLSKPVEIPVFLDRVRDLLATSRRRFAMQS